MGDHTSFRKGQKLKLPNVTLAAMTSVKIYETIKALKYSMQGIEFGEVVLITHRKPFFLPRAGRQEKIPDPVRRIGDVQFTADWPAPAGGGRGRPQSAPPPSWPGPRG